ncbi:hypothetical protein CAPTEDRAFT_190585 [Capitella teleta]|uniref:Reverse transcriptase domain-containing protein n=1 Tax=Capitella teleta TaxID=283909 RepID=R7UA72_CAPTE|nr:hypothetical protein CAPTEDRAFT_190585 [Capitella teleta]|eukprot:ELU03001.1 hypothetical protein CAPTEDRAFT_190585 [Capitella teleta]
MHMLLDTERRRHKFGKCMGITIEEDLRIAAKWADIWGMRFNTSKTVAMYISRTTATPPPITFAGATLEYSHKHRHLGFNLDSALSFHAHVNALTRKGATEVFLLRRLSYKVKDRDLLLKIYKIFHSQVHYATSQILNWPWILHRNIPLLVGGGCADFHTLGLDACDGQN